MIDYNSRRCLRDYALLNLIDRLPEAHVEGDKLPEKGYLKEVIWENDASSITELQWDIRVKKRGRSTGVTYGIIAGVHRVMKSSEGGSRREFGLSRKLSPHRCINFLIKGIQGACLDR